VGWGPDLYKEVQNAKKPEAGWCGCWEHQEACLEVLPAEDRVLPYRTIPALDEIPFDSPVLVVQVPKANEGLPFKEVPTMEECAEDPVEGGMEGSRERKVAVESSRAVC